MSEYERMETFDEQQRRFLGKLSGNPGEGFAEIRSVLPEEDPYEKIHRLGRQFARLSKQRARLLDYEDNPEQLLLQCPGCGLQNDFTFEGRQVYFFARDIINHQFPACSTTGKRIRILGEGKDKLLCQCGNCGEEFSITPSP